MIGLGDDSLLAELDGSILATDVGIGGLSDELLPQGVACVFGLAFGHGGTRGI